MMRIGIMLRAIDETGGIGIYTRNIVEELLKIDAINRYVLFFRTRQHLGRYSRFPNVTETIVSAPHKLLWDQVAIPLAARRRKIDVLFHPKFTVPFLTSARTVMVVHGADWFIAPYDEVYNRLDVRYIKIVMPCYFRKASFVISVSDYSTDGFVKAIPQHKDKIKTIYFAPNRIFQPVDDPQKLEQVRQKYSLPQRFLLTVIRYDQGRKKYRKNFGNMARAFAYCRQNHGLPHKLVVVGKNCDRFAQDYDLTSLGVKEHVIFTGLVPQEDLPAFYSLADLYLYPTVIEAFPIPITEAMACGCPIVTSRGTGLEELADGAALLVDPSQPREIGDAVQRLLSSPELRERLRNRGFERSKIFSWERCARQTLEVFEKVRGGAG